MEKVCALARLLAILVAIAAAFVAIPQVAPILLLLGAISGIDNTSQSSLRVYVVTVVLILGAKSLEVIPGLGEPLAEIFGNIGTAMLGYSIVAIAIRMAMRVKADWIKA